MTYLNCSFKEKEKLQTIIQTTPVTTLTIWPSALSHYGEKQKRSAVCTTTNTKSKIKIKYFADTRDMMNDEIGLQFWHSYRFFSSITQSMFNKFKWLKKAEE